MIFFSLISFLNGTFLRFSQQVWAITILNESGSALILLSWIRIRSGNADPYQGAWKLAKFN